MTSAYDKCIEKSLDLQRVLDQELDRTDKYDLLIDFIHIAKAFPSKTPNPYSFEIPQIDSKSLEQWANQRGWDVKPAPEATKESKRNMPPIRFTRNNIT
ncbi:MAG: hypothetical protein N0C81_03185 [Candidatus Thiodiazotropha lotti]|nr:hypothetical protein [Candidatus Thiodiazotropha lotti]MCG8004620.1 hypothetical protein [Candidatus Thiodiazotropha lotti]MCG8006638.1 hypothetical protein [Candidatus Thiodiazotropha lotti]MCW4188247.1 hypothetical protein [Candidatus Thiodiazotropha lotti]MCW4194220.1 hypothetical protein [Candidatus Thiodiazotropha lotti]